MKVAKNLKIGDLVYIPDYEFAKYRTGWNGWNFTVATIEKLYVSKSGRKCATVKYCVKSAGKNQLLPCVEATKNLYAEYVFQYDFLSLEQRNYTELKKAEDNGETVCWSKEIAFLVNNGFVK